MSRSRNRFEALPPAPPADETAPPPARRPQADLIAVLKSEAPRKEKADACRELAAAGSGEAVPALAALLPDEKLSHMARYGLEPIPEGSVDEALREALGKLKGRQLVGVIGSLGVRRDARSVEPLSRLLADGDGEVVQAAARALAKIATPEAARSLKEKLAAAGTDLRAQVADAALTCAENLLARGQRAEALALYEGVGRADLPAHFRVAVKEGTARAR